MSLFRGRRGRAANTSGPQQQADDFVGSNPLLLEFRARDGVASPADIVTLTATYAFAIPTDAALSAIARHSPSGIVEIGAGTGYWASLLEEVGIDVVAFDPAPAGSADNTWFHSSASWFPVGRADNTVVDRHGDRTLLLVWPTRNEAWPAESLQRFLEAGGDTVVYVGEGVGGPTGDVAFHRLLGEVDQCLACTYGVLDTPCVCDIEPQWHRIDTVPLPHWPGRHDDLHVYRARSASAVF
ncbi:MAG: methyltransferase domain-containing protein [Actinomycetota bacterium]